MDIEMEKELFTTCDLTLASYLYCLGTTLTSIEHENPRRCVFVFQSPRPELIAKFREGRANANVLALFTAYQELKGKMFRGES